MYVSLTVVQFRLYFRFLPHQKFWMEITAHHVQAVFGICSFNNIFTWEQGLGGRDGRKWYSEGWSICNQLSTWALPEIHKIHVFPTLPSIWIFYSGFKIATIQSIGGILAMLFCYRPVHGQVAPLDVSGHDIEADFVHSGKRCHILENLELPNIHAPTYVFVLKR